MRDVTDWNILSDKSRKMLFKYPKWIILYIFYATVRILQSKNFILDVDTFYSSFHRYPNLFWQETSLWMWWHFYTNLNLRFWFGQYASFKNFN